MLRTREYFPIPYTISHIPYPISFHILYTALGFYTNVFGCVDIQNVGTFCKEKIAGVFSGLCFPDG